MVKFKLLLIVGGLSFLVTSCKQENMIFYPDKLPAGYQFTFEQEFEELFFKVDENISLHGLLFRADSSKGLVFYLHGNGGANDLWGQIADIYLENNYDFFVLDYRGYGKSQGEISGEKQFYNDIQHVYDSLKTSYNENNIVVIGFSIGTGPATKLASDNNPRLLILKAPYYNLPDLVHAYYKIIPSFLIKYRFMTNEFIKEVKSPVVIFHGDRDEVIYKGSSDKLKKLFKAGDRLIILEGQKHNNINNNPVYREELRKILMAGDTK